MADQTQAPQNLVESMEIEAPLDLGEATPPPVESDSAQLEARSEVEHEGRVEQMMVLADGLKTKVVELKLITVNEAENYQLAEVSGQAQPKARELKKMYEEIAEQLKSDDESKEKRQELRRRQAALVAEYTYNTVGLLYRCYHHGLDEKIGLLQDSMHQHEPNSKQQALAALPLAKEALVSLIGMGGLATGLESFSASVNQTLKKIVEKDPEFSNRAYILNQALRVDIGLGAENSPDKNQTQEKELENLLGSLVEKIRLERIDSIVQRYNLLIIRLEKQAGEKESVSSPVAKDQGDLESTLPPEGPDNSTAELPLGE